MRIRTIKPEFWSHPVLSALDDGARLLAIGLLNLADDEGYFLSHPTLVRNALRPFDEDSSRTRRGLETLEKVGWIEVRNHSEQGQVGKVLNFQKHQRIDRPTPSKIATYFNSTSARRGLVEDSSLERKGREGIREWNGMDGASPNGSPESGAAPEEAKPEAPKKYTQARIVLHALNEAAGRHYRETETNLDFIRCRLEEPGVTVEGCIAMIRRQVARWKTDPKMAEFLAGISISEASVAQLEARLAIEPGVAFSIDGVPEVAAVKAAAATEVVLLVTAAAAMAAAAAAMAAAAMAMAAEAMAAAVMAAAAMARAAAEMAMAAEMEAPEEKVVSVTVAETVQEA
jgi:hypothetical protein